MDPISECILAILNDRDIPLELYKLALFAATVLFLYIIVAHHYLGKLIDYYSLISILGFPARGVYWALLGLFASMYGRIIVDILSGSPQLQIYIGTWTLTLGSLLLVYSVILVLILGGLWKKAVLQSQLESKGRPLAVMIQDILTWLLSFSATYFLYLTIQPGIALYRVLFWDTNSFVCPEVVTLPFS